MTPGEGVVNLRGMSMLGPSGLDAINSGTLLPASASGGESYDYSRHNTWSPNFTVVAPDPQRAAGSMQFRLRRMALEMAT